MKKKIFLFIFSFSFFLSYEKVLSVGKKSGEITYSHVNGLTYQIDITLYTEFLFIDWPSIDNVYISDGSTLTFNRDIYFDFPETGIRQSVYSEMHTFSSPGTFIISLVLNNREGNIANIPNSFFTPFAVSSELVISPLCPNNSVRFSDLPTWYMQHNKIYTQNTAILNPDHDSLSFELVPCLGESALPIPGYFIPSGFSIDPISGELSSGGFPDTICTYGLAIKITEWKEGIKSGFVMRDFVIDIHPDTINSYDFVSPPLLQDTGGNYYISVNLYDTVSLDFQYADSSTFPELNAYGEAFSVGNPAAININSGTSNTASAHLSWVPDSTHSRPYPYIFTFRGSNDIQQTDLTVLVYVNGPKPDSCYTSPIGIEEILNNRDFAFYPNPVLEKLTIRSQFAIEHIEIYNVLGNKTYSSPANCESCIVHCESFPPGIYFVKATSGEKTFFEKFIKE